MSLSTDNKMDFEVLLDSNSNFTPQSNNVKLLVKNIPETVLYRKEAVQSKSNTNFTFSIDTDSFFVDRGVMINIENIPLKVRLKNTTGIASDAAANATEYDFHEKLFKNYEFLTMKHLGFHNCIDKIQVSVDGEGVQTDNVASILQTVSKCYGEEVLNKYFDASQEDYVYDDAFLGENISYIPSFTTKNTPCLIKKPNSTLDVHSPYSSVVNSNNNSRTPLFHSFKRGGDISSTASVHELTLSNLSCWLPFNIFSISSENNISIYNSSKIRVNVSLHNDWVSRLFNSIPVVAVDFKKTSRYEFTLDNTKFTGNEAGEISLFVKLIKPPQAINALVDRSAPYIFEYPKVVEDTRSTDVNFGENEVEKTINSTPFDLVAIPSKIFISVTPNNIQPDDFLINNNHFCRWNNMKIELFGQTTELASGWGSEFLYNLSKKNGLTMNKQSALYTVGFPVVIDVAEDLGAGANSYVGLNTSSMSGKYTVRISGGITRLHTDDNTSKSHKQLAKSYKFKCIFTYVAYFAYNINGRKFSQIESLTSSQLETLNARVDDLYNNLVPRINVLGGAGIWGMLGSKLKDVGLGLKNIVSAAITNKNGFRDNLAKAYKGSGSSNIIGGLDSHSPMGGRMIDNWGAY